MAPVGSDRIHHQRCAQRSMSMHAHTHAACARQCGKRLFLDSWRAGAEHLPTGHVAADFDIGAQPHDDIGLAWAYKLDVPDPASKLTLVFAHSLDEEPVSALQAACRCKLHPLLATLVVHRHDGACWQADVITVSAVHQRLVVDTREKSRSCVAREGLRGALGELRRRQVVLIQRVHGRTIKRYRGGDISGALHAPLNLEAAYSGRGKCRHLIDAMQVLRRQQIGFVA